jgi:peptidoglycan/xylan/chitin deacetylase (PgdA/CDA1 family)
MGCSNQKCSWLQVVALGLAFLTALGVTGQGLAATQGPICQGLVAQKQIALTFDDGPHPGFTPKILKLLKKYQARATFFVLGQHALRYPQLIKKLVEAGQEVGNHSFTHVRFPCENKAVWQQELARTELELDLLGCPRHRLFRPPFSDYNEALLKFLAHIRQRLVLWSVDSADWREPEPLSIAVKILSQVAPGAIVILHDSDETGKVNRQPTVEALGLILPALQTRGYQCVTISELLSFSPSQEQGKTPVTW